MNARARAPVFQAELACEVQKMRGRMRDHLLPAEARDYLLALTPADYTGNAAEQARALD